MTYLLTECIAYNLKVLFTFLSFYKSTEKHVKVSRASIQCLICQRNVLFTFLSLLKLSSVLFIKAQQSM